MMELEEACRKQRTPDGTSVAYEDVTAICARKLTFSYGRDQVLDQSGFLLPIGAFAVITGPSGIGKSTLLKLMLGIFPPLSGELYLDTKKGQVAISESTRELFAYVPQGNLLFSGTLRENLLLTNPHATDAQIAEAVYVSGMDGFLSQLPEGLETVLGENAHGLSEGQAQRLSIARAVLGGAPILLLDECTSALDARTEEEVLRRLRALPGRTCIAVTHRPAAMALADWHLMVEGGGIICNKLFCK
jgi:ATP-binding cassette subfamily B protein